jgi:hypothetical protein
VPHPGLSSRFANGLITTWGPGGAIVWLERREVAPVGSVQVLETDLVAVDGFDDRVEPEHFNGGVHPVA